MSPAPAEKVVEYEHDLALHLGGPPSEFRLAQIMRDCEAEIARAADPGLLARLHLAAGVACGRRRKHSAALDHYNLCLRYAPQQPIALYNSTLMLLWLDRVDDALDRVVRLMAHDEDGAASLALFATVLGRAGQSIDALEMFEEAAAKAVTAVDHLQVALAAAHLELHAEACEMFARAIAIELKEPLGEDRAIEVILRAPESVKGCLRYDGAEDLQRSIQVISGELMSREEDAVPWCELPEGADEDARRVYAAMAPLRARANRAVLGHHG